MTFRRRQSKDITLEVMENCGRNDSAGLVGSMVVYSSGTPYTSTSYLDTVITITEDSTASTLNGSAITANLLIGYWVNIRGGGAADADGYSCFQITANDAFNGASKTVTINNSVTGAGQLKSDTLGYDADGTDKISFYITQYPILGRQTRVGTDYGPYFMKSATGTTEATITEGFSAGCTMTVDEFNGKFLQVLSGKYKGKTYAISDTAATTLVVSTGEDTVGFVAQTYASKCFFRIMDWATVAATDIIMFDPGDKSDGASANNSIGSKYINGSELKYEGSMEIFVYDNSYYEAAKGGVMYDSSYYPHALKYDNLSYAPGAATGTKYVTNGYGVIATPDRVPSDLTNGMDGWPLNHCMPPGPAHLMFRMRSYNNKTTDKYVEKIYGDCVLLLDSPEKYVSEDEQASYKFKMIVNADAISEYEVV